MRTLNVMAGRKTMGELRMKLGSAHLRQDWAKLLESGTWWFILAIFKQHNFGGKSYLMIINCVYNKV